jgi:sulfate permease, SulP family
MVPLAPGPWSWPSDSSRSRDAMVQYVPSAAVKASDLACRLRYERAWLMPDVVAGLTVGAMLIPQSMGYAELAGLPPQYGFYAVVGALLVYAAIGTSRHLGVGPEPGTAILAGTAVSSLANGDAARSISLMATLALLVGAICVGAAALRLGHLASLLSRPVLIGYISGVGLTLLSSQLSTVTGVTIDADSFFPRVAQLARDLRSIRWWPLTLAAVLVTVMAILRRRAPKLPTALIAVVTSTAFVAAFALEQRGIALVGTIPRGLPRPAWPVLNLQDVIELFPAAAGIALVGFTDNVLTARSIANRHGYRIEPNRELLALGAINVTSSLSHGFPISSSASRTAVPASLGSRTQLVSVIASGFVVATLFALHPVLAEIPRAALAAVIITAALSIIDLRGFRDLAAISRSECALASLALLGVVVLGVLQGIVVAVALSLVVALTRVARPHDAVLGDLPGEDGWVDIDEFTDAVTHPGLVVFRFDAPLFFLNAERFSERVRDALVASPGVEEWLVIDFEGIGAIDSSGITELSELVTAVHADGVEVVAVARANDRVLALLDRARMREPVGPLRIYPTINAAVRAFRRTTNQAADA